MTISEIIERFGGTSALATALGAPISTVDSWKRTNYIPAWRQRHVLELAFEQGVNLSATDFPEREADAA
jgi:hypothetical protein